jgi:RHS repeat-associated protein
MLDASAGFTRAVRAGFLSAVALGFASVTARAQQILETYNDSLTTYKPTGNTAVQGVRPLAVQRGVTLDGAMRARPGFSMALAGNPFENAWNRHEWQGDLRIDIGAYEPFDVDIALPTKGLPWVVGRTYNAEQKNSGGSAINSNGYQGKNWFQTSQPEILFFAGASDTADQIYLVYGADRYVEFTRTGHLHTQFKGKNGSAGGFDYQSGSPDLWVYTDQVGNQFTFFGANTTSHACDWQFWKMTDPAGNLAYVGNSSNAGTAQSSGYDGSGRITTAYDASDHRFTYTYSTLNSVVRLTQVKAETKTGGTWSGSPTGVATATQVDYTYFGNESHGDIGDLKQVKITTRLNDSAGETDNQVKRKSYRYWEGSSDDTPNYGGSILGYPHAIKYVYDFEGTRRYDWLDSTFDEDHLDTAVTDATLSSYASAYFEYDSSHRVNLVWFDGQCGCSGGVNGTNQYTFGTSGYTNNAGYDTDWATRTVIQRPDSSYLTQYFDELGQGLSQVLTDTNPSGTPATTLATQVIRDGNGGVISIHTPENTTTYTHSTGAFTPDHTVGLVRTFARTGSGTYTGFATDWLHQSGWYPGSQPTAYFDGSQTFTSLSKTITNLTVYRPLIASRIVYSQEISGGSSGAYTTSFSYTDYSGSSQPLTVEKVTQTNPAVDTSHNGSGSSTVAYRHYKKDGMVDFVMNEDATIDYSEYTNGQLTRQIQDADTSLTSTGQELDGVTIPSGFSSSGSPLRWKTTKTYTSQGFPLLNSPPTGNTMMYRSVLADGRLISLTYNDFVAGSPDTYYGPVGFNVQNQAGRSEASGSVALSSNSITTGQDGHIDESKSDPIQALGLGSVARTRTSILSDTGTEEDESRDYFLIPGSGAGSSGTNYDAKTFAYDEFGRQIRSKDATSTISRRTYDLRGAVIDDLKGSNDHGMTKGDVSGSSNMVTTHTNVLDANGYQTKSKAFKASGSSDETNLIPDYRGRTIAVEPPTGPLTVNKYDNMGRLIATGVYASGTTLSVSSDPTSDTTGRLALQETFYDEMGRVWKTVRHKIDHTDGSDDDTLLTLNWYDERGRLVKTDGPQLQKTLYDRLGRVTDEFLLAVDDDAVYNDVVSISDSPPTHLTKVNGDIVLEQHETRYDTSVGTVLLDATISRFHSDCDTGSGETTGELDTNGDTDAFKLTSSDVKGRIQITAKWYDSLERLVDQVEYGTYGASTFDRNGLSAPSRSDTALRTTWTYNTDGTIDTITDPRALVTKRFYDGAGRMTKEAKNYSSGVNSGNPYGTDQNVTVTYGYTNGLRTSLTAVMPSGGTNQVTTYIYGTTSGTPSQMKISTGNLLRAIKYPDSSNSGTTSANIDSDSSDVVSFAYDAQGREVYKKDQGGNVIETDFDTAGRTTEKRVTTLGSGFDGAVRRIETAYDSLGRTYTVAQWDNATVGSGSATDGVKYAYDDWGNLTSFREDRNSEVDAMGSVDDYSVSYAWGKATTGRNTLRKTSETLPSGASYNLNYDSRNGLHDAQVSRVTYISSGSTPLVLYNYNGVSQVVGQKYAEPAVQWKEFTSTPGDYADLDRFNRVVKSRWTKNLVSPVDFYHVELSYDRDSNIVTAEDKVHTGFDALYTMDNMNRLTEAKEGSITWSGMPLVPSVTTCYRDEQWTLSHTGNWDVNKVDLNGDLDFSDAGELNDTRAHDTVNQLNTRDKDSAGGVDYTLAYDGSGDLTDDGQSYKYEWDAFLRLRKIKNQSNQLVAEYRYNGVGYRIAEHIDTDTDGDVDSNDKWFYDAFDERWRQVARFRESDTSPKEEVLHHQAGLDGLGGGSYIDLVALRNKDANTAWTSTSDGVLEERIYYCQNWSFDVSAIVDSNGHAKEWEQYSAYNAPFGIPMGDANSDGKTDSSDDSQVQTWISALAYDVRGDADLDGDVDAVDKAGIQSAHSTQGKLVISGLGNLRGANGVQIMPCSPQSYSVRNRVLNCELGGWISRDPLQYIDGVSLYGYLRDNPIRNTDPFGLHTPVFHDQCGQAMHDCLMQHSPTYAWLVSLMADLPGEADVYTSCIGHHGYTDVHCDPGGGGQDPDSSVHAPKDNPVVLAHEMSHAANQQSSAGGPCNPPSDEANAYAIQDQVEDELNQAGVNCVFCHCGRGGGAFGGLVSFGGGSGGGLAGGGF